MTRLLSLLPMRARFWLKRCMGSSMRHSSWRAHIMLPAWAGAGQGTGRVWPSAAGSGRVSPPAACKPALAARGGAGRRAGGHAHDGRCVARQRRLVLVGLVDALHCVQVARVVLEDDLGAAGAGGGASACRRRRRGWGGCGTRGLRPAHGSAAQQRRTPQARAPLPPRRPPPMRTIHLPSSCCCSASRCSTSVNCASSASAWSVEVMCSNDASTKAWAGNKEWARKRGSQGGQPWQAEAPSSRRRALRATLLACWAQPHLQPPPASGCPGRGC
jgi:hypothetical protein